MEKKFTPGHWMVIEDERADEVRVVQEDGYSDFMYTEICQIRQGISEAYLIAAAPDLLEALELILPNIEALATERFGSKFLETYKPVLKAREAIAKAYGKEVDNG